MASIRLRIETAGDVLRTERLTRRLRDHLGCHHELGVEIVQVDAPPIEGARTKGAAEVATLLLAVTPLVKGVAPVLHTALTDWFARNKHTSVVVERDGQGTIKLGGQSAAEQERLLRAILGDAEEAGQHEPGAR